MRRLLLALTLVSGLAHAQAKIGGAPCKIGVSCTSGGGSGTVTSVGNGTINSAFTVSWATATTTPALSLALSGPLSSTLGGNGADFSACSGALLFASGTATCTSTTGTGNFARVTGPTITSLVPTFTDVTTGNVSTSAHGLVPKAPNDATKFLDGTGAFSVPAGGGSPAGSGTEIQYRAGASTFGAVPGSNTRAAGIGLGTPTTADVLADTLFATSATTQKGLVIQGKAGQTANLLEVQDSTGVGRYVFGAGDGTTAMTFTNAGYISKLSSPYHTLVEAGASGYALRLSGGTVEVVSNTLQMGGTNASATARTISGESIIPGFTNVAGGNLVVTSGAGTGSATGSSIVFQTPTATTSGTTGQTQTTRMSINESGLVTAGAAPAVSNTSANSCGTTAATITGNDTTGVITVGATAGTSCTLTFTAAATTRRQCTVSNETTANLARASYVDSTHTVLAGTFVAGDLVSYVCATY